MLHTVYLLKKNIVLPGDTVGVVICIYWSMVQFRSKIFISHLVECMSSYNIRIYIFYEFNGLNL